MMLLHLLSSPTDRCDPKDMNWAKMKGYQMAIFVFLIGLYQRKLTDPGEIIFMEQS